MVSYQREWQRKRQADGLCILCEAKSVGKYYCAAHLESSRAWRRNWYRRKVGIPDSAPLIKSGRPRKY